MQDKVNISVAIIPMAQDFGWSPTVSGLVQSSFFYGYALTQIPGGYVTSRIGGRKVLPAGVSLWSAATAAVPLLAGTIPGMNIATMQLLLACPQTGCSHSGSKHKSFLDTFQQEWTGPQACSTAST